MSAERLDPHALPGGQARSYLAAIVESSADAIKAKTLDGTIVFWNRATERMYGYAAEEAIGRNVSFVIPPERPNELSDILARVARGERVEHYETERVRKDGTRVDVSISVSPVHDESGAVVGAATIARDITERRRIERGQRLLATAAGALVEAGLDPAAIADGLAGAAVGTLADFCAVEVLGEDGALHLAAVRDTNADLAEARRRLMDEHPLHFGERLGGRIVETGEAVLVPVVDPDALRAAMAEHHRPQADLLRLGSLLGVPMRAYGRPLGALLLGRHDALRPFAEQDVVVVQELADRAAMALDAARVHAGEERARRQAEHLAAITRQIGRSLALGDVLDGIADAAAELLGSPVVGVFLLDAAGEAFDLAAGRGLDRAQGAPVRLPRRRSAAGRAISGGRTVVVDDAREETALLGLLVAGESVGSLVVAPIGAATAPLGVVEVYAPRPGAFTPGDADLLTALADAAAVAVANARLHEELREQAATHVQLNAELRQLADARDEARAAAERALARTAFLSRASGELAGSLDYETTLATVAHLAVPGFADWCAVDLVGEGEVVRRLAVAHVDPSKVAVAQEIERRYPTAPDAPTGVPAVVRTGRAELYPDIPDELLEAATVDAEHLALARALGLRSAVIAPMSARGRVLGALSLVWAESGRHYDDGDLAVAEDLAQRCAAAIDNALLYQAAGAARADAEAERDRLRQVVEELPEGVVVLDAGGRVVVSNAAARTTLGLDPVGWSPPTGPTTMRDVRRPGGEAVAPADLPIARALARGETVHGEQIVVHHAREEREVALLVSATPLRGAGGAVEGAVAVFQDITEIRDLERERDAMLATAAHDLKNPLGAVKGAAQLLLRSLQRTGTVPTERLGPSLGMIEDTATRMAASLDELLDATRLRLGQPLALDRRPTDLVGLARRLAATYQAATDAHRIVVDAAVPELVGDWDEARIGRVVANLLSNAVKFSPAGGDVRVEVGTEDGARAVLRVYDQGVGVPPADAARVFERFARAANAAGVPGSGIGLAGARQIVEQHGGTIGVESTGGAGATFAVRLPLRGRAEAGATESGG